MADPTFDDYLRRLFHIESGGDPYNRTGSNRGLAQFGPAEERMYGINDSNRHLPEAQGAAVAREYAQNHKILTNALGREPTFAEHYFTHQQGQAGGPAILTGDPNEPAWKTIRPFYKSDRIAQSAIMGNIPSDSPLKRMNVNDISNGGFSAMWNERFNRGLPGGGGTGTAPTDVAGGPAPQPGGPVPAPQPGGWGPLSDIMSKLGLSKQPTGAVSGNVALAPPAPGGLPQAGPTPSGTTLDAQTATVDAAQRAINREKEAEGEKQSKQMMALAQQLMAAGQAPKPNFMQLAPINTNPVRPLPLNLPPGFGSA